MTASELRAALWAPIQAHAFHLRRGGPGSMQWVTGFPTEVGMPPTGPATVEFTGERAIGNVYGLIAYVAAGNRVTVPDGDFSKARDLALRLMTAEHYDQVIGAYNTKARDWDETSATEWQKLGWEMRAWSDTGAI